MKRWKSKAALSVLFCLGTVVSAVGLASDAKSAGDIKPGYGNKQQSAEAQAIMANPDVK